LETTPKTVFQTRFFCALFFLTLVSLTLVTQPYAIIRDGDTGWHLAAGHDILTRGHVPTTDPFSYTAQDYPWMNLAWGWDALATLIEQAGGLYAVCAFSVLLYALGVALAGAMAITTRSRFFAVCLWMIPILPVLLNAVYARPGVVAGVLGLILLWLIQSPRRSLWGTCMLSACIGAAWVNLHGSFPVAFTLFAAYGGAALIRHDWPAVTAITAMTVSYSLGLCLNPYGWQVITAILLTLQGNSQQMISEWASPFASPETRWMVVPLLLMAALYLYRWHAISLAEHLLFVFWAIAACVSWRYLPLALLLNFPTSAKQITPLIEQWQTRYPSLLREELHRVEQWLSHKPIPRLLWLIPLLPVIGGGFLHANERPARYAELEPIIAAIDRHACHPLLNHYDVGGDIIYLTHARIPVFVDSRAETAYPASVIADALRLHRHPVQAERLAAKYQAELILLPSYATAPEGWREEAMSASYTLYGSPDLTRCPPHRD